MKGKGASNVYARVGDLAVREEIESRRFDAKLWRTWFDIYKTDQNREAMRDMRKVIQFQTIAYFSKLKYALPDGTVVKIAEPQKIVEQATTTEFHDFTYIYVFESDIPPPLNQPPVITVVPCDCLEVALTLKQQLNLNPLILNMASPKRPGGGFRNGSAAQEESIFRRTNYFQVLEDKDKLDKKRSWGYPLGEFSAVYSPSVFVIRDSEEKGYALLPTPIEMSFIAVAAYRRPGCHIVKGVYSLTQSMADGTKRKIRSILHLAREKGHDSLVLSAFGCGVFKNPAKHMAQLFKEVIEEEFSGYFVHISFAIINDHNSVSEMNPEGNYNSFRSVFPNAANSLETKEAVCRVETRNEAVDAESSKTHDKAKKPVMTKKFKDIPIKTDQAIAFNNPQDPYGCFSSAFKACVEVAGVSYPSVEHFLQYHKYANETPVNRAKILKTLSVDKMLALVDSFNPREDWEQVKDTLLEEATRAKFVQHSELAEVLRSTKNLQLIYHNQDSYFGDGGDGLGENALGKLLVQIRDKSEISTENFGV